MTKPFALVLALLSIGCTTVNVKKLDRTTAPMTSICIEENPKVWAHNLLPFLETQFKGYGINTATYKANSLPANCEYSLWYTALRHWDFAPYLSFAEFRIQRDNKTIASATYDLNIGSGGGFSLAKWASLESKLTPVINELLADFR